MTDIGNCRAVGPVATVLDAEVRRWVRRHGVVFWLDLDGHYSDFVEQKIAQRQAGELPFEVLTRSQAPAWERTFRSSSFASLKQSVMRGVPRLEPGNKLSRVSLNQAR